MWLLVNKLLHRLTNISSNQVVVLIFTSLSFTRAQLLRGHGLRFPFLCLLCVVLHSQIILTRLWPSLVWASLSCYIFSFFGNLRLSCCRRAAIAWSSLLEVRLKLILCRRLSTRIDRLHSAVGVVLMERANLIAGSALGRAEVLLLIRQVLMRFASTCNRLLFKWACGDIRSLRMSLIQLRWLSSKRWIKLLCTAATSNFLNWAWPCSQRELLRLFLLRRLKDVVLASNMTGGSLLATVCQRCHSDWLVHDLTSVHMQVLYLMLVLNADHWLHDCRHWRVLH